MSKRILMLVYILVLPTGICSVTHYTSAQNTSIITGVFYYAWYDGTIPPNSTCPNQGHWNRTSSNWAVEDSPFIGFYNSSDPAVAYRQLSEMNALGIDFVIVSWWGMHPYDYGQQAPVDNAVRILYSVANSSFPNIKIVIMVEGFNESGTYDFNYIKSYIYTTFYNAYPNEMFFLNNSTRPLLCWWNAPVMTNDDNRGPIHDDTIFDDRILGQDVYPRVDWYAWTPCSVNMSQTPYLNNKDGGVTTIEPRYDGSHIGQGANSVFDPTYSQRLYDSQWNYVLQNKDRIKYVLIYSWNEYHERSQIEPCFQSFNQSSDPYYCYEKTRDYINKQTPSSSPMWPLIASGVLGAIIASGIVTFYFLKVRKKSPKDGEIKSTIVQITTT